MDKKENIQLLDLLTPREIDVLNQLAEGLSNREIAESLDLTVNTTKWYLRQIYSKLGANRRTKAVLIARETGLLDMDNSQAADSSQKHNLPHPTTPFFGRSQELVNLENLFIQPDTRLITITGIGGIGKTRLAVEVARRNLNLFADGVYFIPLAALQSPSELFQIIGIALDLKFHGTSDARDQVLGHLRHREVLLVLDNFEHLLDEGAQLVGDILMAVPDLQILCTSRQKLNLLGEAVYAIRGLDYPEWQPTELSRYSAVQLFIQRAILSDPQIEGSEQIVQKASRICHLVEGMPLAIELAASWTASLSLSEIAAQIERSLDLLAAEMHDLPQRQRNMRAVFEHSWRLLSDSEQDVFSRLSVFSGGFTLEAAKTITGTRLHVIAGLLSKSLLRRDRQTNRYDMHELVRKYAQQKLESDSVLAEETQRAHCAYYSSRGARWGQMIRTAEQLPYYARLSAEYNNITSAWRCAVKQLHYEYLDRFTELGYYFTIQGLFEEAKLLFEQSMKAFEDSNHQLAQARASTELSVVNYHLGNLTIARKLAEHGRELMAQFEPQAYTIEALLAESITHTEVAQCETRVRLLKQALSLAEDIVDSAWHMGLASHLLAGVYMSMGQLSLVEAHIERARVIREKIGDRWGLSHTYHLVCVLKYKQGHLQEAFQIGQKALRLAREIGFRMLISWQYAVLGHIYREWEQLDKARSAYKHSLALAREINLALHVPSFAANLGELSCEMHEHNAARCYFLQAIHSIPEIDSNHQTVLQVLGRAVYALFRSGVQLDIVAFILTLDQILAIDGIDRAIEQNARSILLELETDVPQETVSSIRLQEHKPDLYTLADRLLET